MLCASCLIIPRKNVFNILAVYMILNIFLFSFHKVYLFEMIYTLMYCPPLACDSLVKLKFWCCFLVPFYVFWGLSWFTQSKKSFLHLIHLSNWNLEVFFLFTQSKKVCHTLIHLSRWNLEVVFLYPFEFFFCSWFTQSKNKMLHTIVVFHLSKWNFELIFLYPFGFGGFFLGSHNLKKLL